MSVSYSAACSPYADTITSPSAKPHRQMDQGMQNGDDDRAKRPHVTATTAGPNKNFSTKLEVVPSEEPQFRAVP